MNKYLNKKNVFKISNFEIKTNKESLLFLFNSLQMITHMFLLFKLNEKKIDKCSF